jgi:predicted transposase/invertase (TIGR01784 family)
MNNIHDKFVRDSFSDPERAAASFEKILPPEFVSQLDLSRLVKYQESYLDEKLKEYFSDLVFEVPLSTHADEKVDIVILFEHKSKPDKYVLVQVGYYMFAHYFRCIHAKPKKKLKPIVPLVYYQGKKKWKEPELWHLFKDYPDTIRYYIPTLNYIFIALHTVPDKTLESIKNIMMTVALMAQKWRDDPARLVEDITRKLSLFENKEIDWNFLQKIFVYILHTSEIESDDVQKLIESVPNNIKEEVMTTYARIQKEERAKGRVEGKRENQIEIVLASFDDKLPISQIARITKLSEAEVKEILRENGRVE